NPIWKTSYRLVLGTKKQEKPYLQGWAVVENPSDEDWREVRMALVSGRPISFQMDLYTPLYVSRPVVVPELFQSLRPVAYSGSMEDETRRMSALRERAAAQRKLNVDQLTGQDSYQPGFRIRAGAEQSKSSGLARPLVTT